MIIAFNAISVVFALSVIVDVCSCLTFQAIVSKMFVWICSFDPACMRSSMCHGFLFKWPTFCLKLAASGYESMRESAQLHKSRGTSLHFIHGFAQVAPGQVFQGPLTPWSDTTFAQHVLFGRPNDAYTAQLLQIFEFAAPVQVHTLQHSNDEKPIQLRRGSMVFTPKVLQSLLNQRLAAAAHGAAITHEILRRMDDRFDPKEMRAVQVAAPLVRFLFDRRIDELFLCASWPRVFPRFPPMWLQGDEPGQMAETQHLEHSWDRWHRALTAARRVVQNVPLADHELRQDASGLVALLEQAV